MSELEQARPLTTTSTAARSFLYYGPGGSGKSSLATLHPGKRKFYVDVDERLPELQLKPEVREAITLWQPKVTLADEVTIVEVDPTRKDVYKGTILKKKPMGYQRTVDLINELLNMAHMGPFPYDLVVLDSLTRIIDHLIYLVMYQHKVSNMTQTLFGVVGRNAKDLVQGFLQLPCDRILIAHSIHEEKRDEDSGAIIYERIRPHIHGARALREELQTYFGEVYYFLGRDRSGKYKVQTATDRMAPARTTRLLEFEQEIDARKIYG